jgi:hypothetical protein
MPLDKAIEAFATWRRSMAEVRIDEHAGPLSEALLRLQPLVIGSVPRELLVAHGAWTAYFNCTLPAADTVSPMGHLSLTWYTRALAIEAIPHEAGLPGVREGRLGSFQWQLLGPEPTEFLNDIRAVALVHDALVHDGRRWEFVTTGTPQPYERPDAYQAKRIGDRFNADLIEEYSRAIGIDPFDAAIPTSFMRIACHPGVGSSSIVGLIGEGTGLIRGLVNFRDSPNSLRRYEVTYSKPSWLRTLPTSSVRTGFPRTGA